MSKQKMTQPSSGNTSVPVDPPTGPLPPAPPTPDIPAPSTDQPLNDMPIDIKIYRPSPQGPVLADATATIGGCFAIRGIRVREGKNGPFVSMPSRKVGEEYHDVCFPCTKEFKAKFDEAVIAAYGQALGQAMTKQPQQTQQTQGASAPTMTM